MISKYCAMLVLAAGLSLALAGVAMAETIVIDEDFESYSPGSIHNVGGWRLNAGSATADDDFEVSTIVAASGSNSLQYFNDGAGSETSWAAKDIGGNTLAGNTVTLEWKTYANTTGRRSYYMKLIGGSNPWDASVVNVGALANSSTGWVEKFIYFAGSSWTYSNVTFTADTWWTCKILYDMTPANAADYTYSFYATPAGGQEQIIGENIAIADGLASYEPQWLYMGRHYGGGTDDWYVDDISMVAIPEPASLALLACGSLLALRKRKS